MIFITCLTFHLPIGLIRGLRLLTQSPNNQRQNSQPENINRFASSDEHKNVPRSIIPETTKLAHTIVPDKSLAAKLESDRSQKQVTPLNDSQIRREIRENPYENRDHRENSSEIFMNGDDSNARATVVVPQLPRIPLALMPCPREEDESRIDDDNSQQQNKTRPARRTGRV